MRTLMLVLAVLVPVASTPAQTTAFTYQGRLKNGPQAASGLHDFRFGLFDAATGGTQLGATQCADNVPVTDGLFTTPIDFGQQFATGGPRFLEIEIRADTGLGCASAVGFVTLGPRQPITATPVSSHANAAFALDAPDGSPVNAVFVSNDGRVGVGTTSPGVSLHIAADPDPILVIQDTGPASTQTGYVGFWNESLSETGWAGFGTPGSPNFSVVNARLGGHLLLVPGSGGNVGIGTATPTARLTVVGDALIGGPLTASSIHIPSTTRSWTLHPYGLTDTTPGTGGMYFLTDGGLTVVGVINEFAGPVHLPDGATIIALEVLGHDGSTVSGADVNATLGRTSFSGGTLAMATVSSQQGGGVWQTTSILSPVVDNDTHSYWVRVSLFGGAVPPSDVTLRAIRIIYRITQPLP